MGNNRVNACEMCKRMHRRCDNSTSRCWSCVQYNVKLEDCIRKPKILREQYKKKSKKISRKLLQIIAKERIVAAHEEKITTTTANVLAEIGTIAKVQTGLAAFSDSGESHILAPILRPRLSLEEKLDVVKYQKQYGSDWEAIAQFFPSRTPDELYIYWLNVTS